MDEAEYKRRLERIYVDYKETISKATKARDEAIMALNNEFNSTRGKT